MATRGGRRAVGDGQLSFDELLAGAAAEPTEEVSGMNRYGRQAQAHWARWRPDQVAQLPDPEEFFTQLGLEVQTQVNDLAAALAGDDPVGEDYLGKVGRLGRARFTAEAQILRELVLLPPEPGHPQAEDEDQDRGRPAEAGWLPMVTTPDHPGYHDMDEDPTLPQNRAQFDTTRTP